jgi:hypothetical protein
LLDHAFPKVVIPVKFSAAVKSDIGWRFTSVIDSGRFKNCVQTSEVLEQYKACYSVVLPGTGKVMRWGVPDGTRGADGELLHDDLVLADSLVAIIDRQEWKPFDEPDLFMYQAPDPLRPNGQHGPIRL